MLVKRKLPDTLIQTTLFFWSECLRLSLKGASFMQSMNLDGNCFKTTFPIFFILLLSFFFFRVFLFFNCFVFFVKFFILSLHGLFVRVVLFYHYMVYFWELWYSNDRIAQLSQITYNDRIGHVSQTTWNDRIAQLSQINPVMIE
jgi:hypothetical protein